MAKKNKKKSPEYGSTTVYMYEVEYETFSDMSFWEKRIPKNCELLSVTICHEPGMYDEPDLSYFNLDWRKNEPSDTV